MDDSDLEGTDASQRLRRERGFLTFDDGLVHAELQEGPDGSLEIWDWYSVEERRGHTLAALQWLRDQGYSRIVVIDATAEAMPYWEHMRAKGLVDEVRPEVVHRPSTGTSPA